MDLAIAHLAALRNLKTLTVEVLNEDCESRLAKEALILIDPFAPAEERKAQFNKIAFVCNAEPNAKMHGGRPAFTLELPGKCTTKLAEPANIALEG